MKEGSKMIRQVLKNSNLKLTEQMIENFEKYAEMLIEWNEKVNLTAITEPRLIAIKHFLDSLLTLLAYDTPLEAKVIDVGTGAGFPGVPIKIARPDIQLTLLDSLKKRTCFLESLTSALNVKASIIHARAEDVARKEAFRESFDVVVSRAVAPLNVLLEYCLPFVKVNGVFLALKGSKAQFEFEQSINALKLLKGEVVDIKRFNLLDGEERNIFVIKKIANNKKEHPRSSAKIKKMPL